MRKSNSKFTSMVLALVMLASLFVVPAQASSEVNEITGLIWNVNSIEGIKLANAVENAANVQTMFAVYESGELASIISAQPEQGSNCVYIPSALNLSSGQTAKAFLWSTANIEPLCRSYFVSAEGEVFSSCEIKGASKIVLPGDKADYRTKHEYALFDNELCENVNASFTISGDTTGLMMNADGTLVATSEAKEGTITVNAQYACKTYTKTVTLAKGLYEDFESYELGAMAATDGWDDSRLGTICSDAQGKYLDGSANTQAIYKFGSDLACENITFEIDIYASSSKKALFQLGAAGADKESASNYYIDYWFNSSLWLRTKYIEDGSSVSYKNLIQFPADSWTKMKMQFNLVDNYYTVWVGDTKIIDNWKLCNLYDVYTFETLILRGCVDNINVYSGDAYNSYEVDGYDTIVLPGDDAVFSTNIAYSLADTDTGVAASDVVYEITGDTAGLSISADGTLTATKDAKAGTVTINATKGGKTYSKVVTTAKGYSTDFEDIEVNSRPDDWSYRYDSTVVAMSDGNKYLERTEGYAAYTLDSKFTGESITLEFDTLLYKPVTNETLPYFMSRLSASGTSEQYYFIGMRDVKQGDVVTEIGLHTNYFDQNGDTMSDRNFVKYVDNNGGSFNTKYVINYVDKTYDLYIDNELILDDYAFPKVGSDYALETIRFRTCIDNVNIYTGTKTVG